MKTITILGAGRSSSSLIRYLLAHAATEDWHVRVGDMDIDSVHKKLNKHARSSAFALAADDRDQLGIEVTGADLVVSMLPASMHAVVAEECIEGGTHLITPSYIDGAMQALDGQARSRGILLLNEMGVDPGIDHMSAMQIIERLKDEGKELESFESYTGGLVSPQSDNNPWHYKITWNPRNVVLAGAGGTARYLSNGKLRYIPYHNLFERASEILIDGHGKFEGYANRDSLKYRAAYGLEKIPSILRGTLRKDGFCKAWNALIRLGLTDDSFLIEHPQSMTWRQLTESFLPDGAGASLEERLSRYLMLDPKSKRMLQWLGLLDEIPVGITEGSPAVALQHLIESKWKLEENDKDLIVMWHRFRFRHQGRISELISTMVSEGEDPVYTAMSNTVGLPIAMAAKRVLRGEWQMAGVHMPTQKGMYDPILKELSDHGISFTESETPIQ